MVDVRRSVSGLARGLAPIALFLMLALQILAPSLAEAQSSVRAPGDAVVNVVPPPMGSAPDTATQGTPPGDALGNSSDSESWRKIRQGVPGQVNNTDAYGSRGALIESSGENWRLWRNDYVIRYGGMVLLGVLTILAVFFAIRGRMRISGGRTGKVIPRFSLVERITHWFVAILFVFLGTSGLIILFGKLFLLPLVGPKAFGLFASASLEGHNLFGPIFAVAILALFFVFVRGNGYKFIDLVWAIKGGGFFGGHPSSGRYNFGEKSWFWWATICGIALTLTGFAMLLPEIAASVSTALVGPEMTGRLFLQFAHLVHVVAAIAFIAFGIGHIYLGTVGMEGALEGMTRGYVDENWAKEHHDLWYEEHKAQAVTDTVKAETEAAAGHV
ncbi:MAG: formate dehydrogenase subunit gamma [Nitratireductor sp.]